MEMLLPNGFLKIVHIINSRMQPCSGTTLLLMVYPTPERYMVAVPSS